MLSYDKKRLGIYIHIPFCVSKCAYCDFNSAPPQNPEIIQRYISALIAHMESYRDAGSSYEPAAAHLRLFRSMSLSASSKR